MNLGILPISLLFDYRAATYCHSIMNKEKPAFSSSALKLPTASFYIHKRTQKIFTQTTSKCNLHEKYYLKRYSTAQFFPKKLFVNVIQSCKVKYKLFFLNEYKKDPNKTQHGSITWKRFKFN